MYDSEDALTELITEFLFECNEFRQKLILEIIEQFISLYND